MNLDGLDTEAQEDVADIKISVVDAMILNFEQRAVNAFEEFNRNNGDLKTYIEKAEPLPPSTRCWEPDKITYEWAVKRKNNEIGDAMRGLSQAAREIKTAIVSLENYYWHFWQLCALMVPDHPDRPEKVKFCEEYRKHEPKEKSVHYWRVGDRTLSEQIKGYCCGEVIAIHGNTMEVELNPTDRRRKTKVIEVAVDSLDFYPADGIWRKGKSDDKNHGLEEV